MVWGFKPLADPVSSESEIISDDYFACLSFCLCYICLLILTFGAGIQMKPEIKGLPPF